MRKYIKLEDAIRNINLEVTGRKEYTGDMKANLFFALDELPTIEVSEDCDNCIWDVCNYNKIDWEVSEDCIYTYCSRCGMRMVVDAPSVVPTTEQSSKVGEWKRHPIHENRAWDICTACGTGCRRRHYGFNEDGTEWVEEENYPFCPNCGAKMKGTE